MAQVLEGKFPFHGMSDRQTFFALMKGTPPARLTIAGPNPTENVIWNLVNRCWSLQPYARPKCRDILEYLNSEGLARMNVGEDRDRDIRERQGFWKAMRGDEEVPIDFNVVDTILNEVYISSVP